MSTVTAGSRAPSHQDPDRAPGSSKPLNGGLLQFPSTADTLCTTITERFARNDSRLRPELCQFVALLPRVCRAQDPWLERQATIAFTYLSREDADRRCARGIIEELALSLGLRKRVPAVHVMAGLGCFLLFLTVVGVGLGVLWQSTGTVGEHMQPAFYLFNVSPWIVIAVGSAGGLGSMMSMFSRLGSYAALTDIDVRELWMIGAVKPLMGVIFALFVFAVLQSGILPFNFEDGPRANYTYLALAFVAGFSERISHVVAAKVEERMLGAAPAAAKTS